MQQGGVKGAWSSRREALLFSSLKRTNPVPSFLSPLAPARQSLAAAARLYMVHLGVFFFLSTAFKGEVAAGGELSRYRGSSRGKWPPNQVWDQDLALPIPAIGDFHSFVETPPRPARSCGSDGSAVPELAVEKPPAMEGGEKRAGLFQAKVNGTVRARQGF